MLDQPKQVPSPQLLLVEENPKVTMGVIVGCVSLRPEREECPEILVKVAQRYAVGLQPPRMELVPDPCTR